MKSLFLTLAIFLAASNNSADKLIGRWQTRPSVNGHVTGFHIKPDKSFEAFINRKPFASGHYSFEDGIFSFTDNGCNGQKAVYKMILFSNDDSIRFELIADSCIPRREGMKRTVLGRIKNK
jgi:hypothetical protein